jgi:hypothetical protein
MRPVETTPGIRAEESTGRVEGVNSSMIYLIHCKDLCKCHNVPPPITTIKKKNLFIHMVKYATYRLKQKLIM